MATAGPLASSTTERLVHGWQICSTPPGRHTSPDSIAADGAVTWLDIPQPAPAAAALRALGLWSLDGAPRRFDAEDWWYRLSFEAGPAAPGALPWLVLDGLAGVAEVWLNGEPLLQSSNMFLAHECALGDGRLRSGRNSLVMRFQSLDALLAQRRPRPRWRTPMVEHQQLRWFRQTLLGRTPGWSPPAAAVGPWKDVRLEWRGGGVRLAGCDLRATVEADVGVVEVSVRLEGLPASASVSIELGRGAERHRAELSARTGGGWGGQVRVPGAALWWPHTHGEPARYDASLSIRDSGDGEPLRLPLPAVGFRTVEAVTVDQGFSLKVNGVPVFCRGACWSPLDAVTLRAAPEVVRDAVALARDAGMNMLRVPGTGVYEDAVFFDACDELGVLVWQDFMFANMDYPADDAAFAASVQAEAAQQLAVWQGRPSLAVVCGNSEVEQQAAMWGAPRELWRPALFHELLAQQVRDALPGVPCWPSSAHGGAFPHQANAGTTSYYGVGAYRRPQEDARRADLRFATECLAFANVPGTATIARMPGGESLRVHHPGWKARAPRDLGAGWDFEDIRDHYLALLYGVDPLSCRTSDHERYLALSRAVTGELMAAAFTEWRRPGSRCGGALVLMLRDLWAGAGWGLVDDEGRPKPCFHALSRALQPLFVGVTDEGGNGLSAHLVNERAQRFVGELRVDLYGPGEARVASTRQAIELPPRGALSWPLAQGLGHFLDLSYAYRFGPPPVTLVHVQLADGDGTVRAEAFHLPVGQGPATPRDIGLAAVCEPTSSGLDLVVSSESFAQNVQIEAEGHRPSDNQFHLAPGTSRRIALVALGATPRGGTFKAEVTALNASRPVFVRHGA